MPVCVNWIVYSSPAGVVFGFSRVQGQKCQKLHYSDRVFQLPVWFFAKLNRARNLSTSSCRELIPSRSRLAMAHSCNHRHDSLDSCSDKPIWEFCPHRNVWCVLVTEVVCEVMMRQTGSLDSSCVLSWWLWCQYHDYQKWHEQFYFRRGVYLCL